MNNEVLNEIREWRKLLQQVLAPEFCGVDAEPDGEIDLGALDGRVRNAELERGVAPAMAPGRLVRGSVVEVDGYCQALHRGMIGVVCGPSATERELLVQFQSERGTSYEPILRENLRWVGHVERAKL